MSWYYPPTYNGYAAYGSTPYSSASYSYTPYGYGSYGYTPHSSGGHPSHEDPFAGAAARERSRRSSIPYGQDATRSRRPSYLSNDDARGSFTPYQHPPYNPGFPTYAPYVNGDRTLGQTIERQRQLQPNELNRTREVERARESRERTYNPREPEPIPTSAHKPPTPVPSPKVPPLASSYTKPTQLPKYTSPQPSRNLAPPEATPEEIHAAMTIQEFYRRRVARKQALTSIHQLSTQFDQLKSTFSPPPRLDYSGPTPNDTTSIATSPESFTLALSVPPSPEGAEYPTETPKSGPRLAFNSNNKVVHEYIENLNRLLVKLDRVESGGDASVRERRKQMIKDVEAEAQRMDRWIAAVWNLANPRSRTQPEYQRNPRP